MKSWLYEVNEKTTNDMANRARSLPSQYICGYRGYFRRKENMSEQLADIKTTSEISVSIIALSADYLVQHRVYILKGVACNI